MFGKIIFLLWVFLRFLNTKIMVFFERSVHKLRFFWTAIDLLCHESLHFLIYSNSQIVKSLQGAMMKKSRPKCMIGWKNYITRLYYKLRDLNFFICLTKAVSLHFYIFFNSFLSSQGKCPSQAFEKKVRGEGKRIQDFLSLNLEWKIDEILNSKKFH